MFILLSTSFFSLLSQGEFTAVAESVNKAKDPIFF